MSHTTFTQSNLAVSSATVNLLFSIMSKRAAESFAAFASAKQNPDNNADMDCHAVLPTENKAGGDSKREEVCQQDSKQFTITQHFCKRSENTPLTSVISVLAIWSLFAGDCLWAV